MGTLLFFVLLAVVVCLAAFATYMLLRIIRVYGKARRLEKMRGYETIMYASLQKLSPERALRLLPDPDPVALEEVLLRMADEGTGEWRERAMELYDLCGFTASRRRQLRSRLKSRRRGAARRLGRVGDAASAPELERLLGDRSVEVREAASFALERIGAAGILGNVPGAAGGPPSPEVGGEGPAVEGERGPAQPRGENSGG